MGYRIKKSRVVAWPAALMALLLSLTPGTSARQSQGGATWHKFSPPGAPFSVSLPGVPEEHAEEPNWGVTRHFYVLTIGPCEYSVVWMANLPDNLLEPESITFLFARAPKESDQVRRGGG
jgi:hypothetical protein